MLCYLANHYLYLAAIVIEMFNIKFHAWFFVTISHTVITPTTTHTQYQHTNI